VTFGQAIAYFFHEAWLSLRRGWRVSLLAILTIAVSIFLGGLFGLLSHNLGNQLDRWRTEARVVVYFEPGTSEETLAHARDEVEAQGWVESVRVVTLEDARQRFGQAFPDLVDVLDDPDAEPLPPSLEIRMTPAARAAEDLSDERRAILARLDRADWVDDDRAWLDRLEALVDVGRAVAWGLGGLLLAAAIFTISSVIRLTAYRYRDEIAVMRQIGATELLIRCPFYLEGFLQGLAGGLVAVGALAATHQWLSPGSSGGALREALAGRFLPLPTLVSLAVLRALAGGLGAILSLRREFFDQDAVLD
jgi:cell division transport system permease protein